MNQTVDLFIKKHNLINKEDHILVAVSGGPDSMALLHYLMGKIHHYYNLSVAHVEHGLRGEASEKDLEFVKKYCEANGVPFYYHQPNVYKVKKEKGYSTQEAARYCRYIWFKQLMIDIDASKLAMAHHGDDQIETVLMRQVRGGISGLRGIPVQRPFGNGSIIRPFLCINKKQIIDYCQKEKINYRIDESNNTENYQRNRFRKHILPFLKEENEKVHEAFQRQSEWFTEEDRFLQKLAGEEIEKVIIEKTSHHISLSISDFFQIPVALQRRGLHLILNCLSFEVGRHVTSRHFDDIITLMDKDIPSAMLNLPRGLCVERVYGKCEFYLDTKDKQPLPIPEMELKIPGIVQINSGKIITTVFNRQEDNISLHNRDIFYADLDKIITPLSIRSRIDGDKMTLLGLDGKKKIKKIFMEEKIPKKLRESWPILVDGKGEILWLPLLKRSNKAIIEETTRNIVSVVYEKGDEESPTFNT